MIFYKTESEIKKLRASGLIVAKVLDKLKSNIKKGITTWDLEVIANDYLKTIDQKAIPAFKGYHGYPTSLCVSVNSEVVHGIPSKSKILVEGDVVSIDFGVLKDGYYGDAAFSKIVGNGSKIANKLLKVTEESLYKGIEKAKIGNDLNCLSSAVQEHVEANGFSVIRDFVGHGIGRNMHEEPQVPNYLMKTNSLEIKEGLTIAIEPMVSVGDYNIKILKDGWTATTIDGSLSAHFEHSIAITKKGTIVLTEF